jgi:hypothetical protein
LATIGAFVLPGIEPVLSFGDKQFKPITVDDIEAFRRAA